MTPVFIMYLCRQCGKRLGEGEENKDGGEVQWKSTRWQPPIHRNDCITGMKGDGSLDVWRNIWNDTEMFHSGSGAILYEDRQGLWMQKLGECFSGDQPFMSEARCGAAL